MTIVSASQEESQMLYQQCPLGAKPQGSARFGPEIDGPMHRWYVPCKLVLEWLIALMLSAVAWPVILALAALVKLTSRGPAFYSQIRLGKHGRPFRMYKIRTMVDRCEEKTGPVWSTPNDTRITQVGRLLRDTHLDELPQLWNILRGQMCLIGPRPERPELVERIEQAIPGYRNRLLIPPGVTGLAQMQRPPDVDLEDVRRKLAYDLYYVRHVSLWLDLRIAVSTGFSIMGAGFHAIGKLLVKSYGHAVEGDPPPGISLQEGARVGPT